MKQYIQKVCSREDLTREEARNAMHTIMNGEASDAQIASLLVGLKLKGEHIDEIAGFVEAMREQSIRINIDDPEAIDMCGTGGDSSGTFNVSTTASFVVAGAGVTVAKHGNRSISSSCGSSDVLQALGVNIELTPTKVQECINAVGIGFLFAPIFHPAMKHASKSRAEMGIKTAFNILGPMTNPAGVRRQLVGAFNQETAAKMAAVFAMLGVTKVCVVHSSDGLDEVSLGATTLVHETNGSPSQNSYYVTAKTFRLPEFPKSTILGGKADVNAPISLAVLKGEKSPYRDTVLANAAFGLYVADKVKTLEEGVALASEAIDSGKALEKLQKLKEFTQYAA
jgi:anthranilate phosphoribosyltransferase